MTNAQTHTTDLSPGELEALEMAAIGETEKSMAHRIGKSTRTVKHRRRRVFEKLGADNITHAVAIAFRRGILK